MKRQFYVSPAILMVCVEIENMMAESVNVNTNVGVTYEGGGDTEARVKEKTIDWEDWDNQ